MKNNSWSGTTLFVAVLLGLGIVSAVMLPSLQRARIAPAAVEIDHTTPALIVPNAPAAIAPGAADLRREQQRPLPVQPPATAPPPNAAALGLRDMEAAALLSQGARSRLALGFAGTPSLHALEGVASQPDFNTESYAHIAENALVRVADQPLSTFSVDVDTASYANVRRFLNGGRLPPKDAVRIEELVNYFGYDYPAPAGQHPFSVTTEVAACPWREGRKLVLIGLQGRRIADEDLPPRNLVFLVDVSGSMQHPSKLPLVKAALSMLTDTLSAKDRVAIVVYAGASGLALPPTAGDRKGEIRAALAGLEAGGSTAGGAGLALAYRVAAESFVESGVNRVILATDGDFNVGVSSDGELVRLIEEKRRSGVFLSVLGFGMGNYKDSKMEALADKGNGNYAYLDSLQEARKVLVEQAGGTLVTIAKDVKIQVEWNPARVSAYRLLGYENRALAAQDFNDDAKDAGEIGAGHSVTALYEVVPAGHAVETPSVDSLKYQQERRTSDAAASGELLTVKLRYKEPAAEKSRLLALAVRDAGAAAPSARIAFASAVAGFGMLLRESQHTGALDYAKVRELAAHALAADSGGYRAEFVRLVGVAEALSPTHKITRN